MNGTEQKAHTKVTDGLDARLTTVEEVLTALDERVSAVAKAAKAEIAVALQQADAKTRELVGEERTHRLTLAQEQRAYVDRGDKPADVFRDRTRTGWGRLTWLIRGI